MHLNLPVDVSDFVRSLVTHGRFASEEAAVVAGVRLLMDREALRSEIQKGVDQVDRGEWSDEETTFSELDAEINKVESSEPGS